MFGEDIFPIVDADGLQLQLSRGSNLNSSSSSSSDACPNPPRPFELAAALQSEPVSSSDPKLSFYEEWLASFAVGMSALRERHSACESTKLGRSSPYELSLVAMPETSTVTLVAWHSMFTPESLQGRPVKIRDGKIVAIMKCHTPVQSFAGCVIVHPAIGLRPFRAGKADRPVVPEQIMRLITMWRSALTPLSEDAAVGCCTGCALDRSPLPAMEGLNDIDYARIFTCCVCCFPWHKACSAHAVSLIASRSIVGSNSVIEPVVLPDEFAQHNICLLCQRALQAS